MTQVNLPVSSSAVPWPTSDDRDWSSGGAILPVQKQTPPAAGSSVTNAGMDAHDTREFAVARVAPAATLMDKGLAAPHAAWPAEAHQPIQTRNAWLDGLRNTVCGSPLMSVAVALALGAALARIAR